MTDLTVAKNIIAQLGGQQFVLMTGCDKFVGDDNSVAFALRRNSSGGNHMKITLDPSDTYSIKIIRVTSRSIKTVHEESDVYCDQLANRFETLTGLYTHL